MSLKGLERLKIVQGDDMRPSIRPDEHLLLDRTARPEIGDVVVFENKLGYRIAHRLMDEFAGYYFTRGDNCPVFNFPVPREKAYGIVVGKRREMGRNLLGSALLALFLFYFIAYRSLFDIRRKKRFLFLSAISSLYPYTRNPKQEMRGNGRNV